MAMPCWPGARHGRHLHTGSWACWNKQHQNLLILGFRFLYGLRSVTPFVIGMSGISWLRFALLNVIGAGIWASAFAELLQMRFRYV